VEISLTTVMYDCFPAMRKTAIEGLLY
jgi:hypothetical protein